MPEFVEIALVGNRAHAFTAGAITWDEEGQAPEFLVPWNERERVVLEVEPTDTLDDILRRAAAEFGIELPPPDVAAFGFCAFYVEDAPGGFAGLKRDWPLADQYGRATWPPRSSGRSKSPYSTNAAHS